MISKSVGSDENENKSRKLYIKKWIPLPPKKTNKKKEKEKASRRILAWLINKQFFEEICQTFYLRN